MSKRKNIPKKIRFEVFKRDKFTCQYCGAKAPDAVLHVDHIHPVSKGGTNDIMNLVTSCDSCNGGKSNVLISDSSAIDKQRAQLEALEERRQQIDMMVEWRKSLAGVEQNKLGALYDYAESYMPGFSLNENGRKDIRKLEKKYGLEEVMKAIETAAEKYIERGSDGNATKASALLYLRKMGGILYLRNASPIDKKLAYIKGIARNRFSFFDEASAAIMLKAYVLALDDAGWASEEILADLENEIEPRTKGLRNWSQWRSLLEVWTADIRGWKEGDAE